MKELTTNQGKFIAVPVPEASKYCLVKYSVSGTWLMDSQCKQLNAWKVKLPPGEWEILFLASKATEEDAKKVVEKEVYYYTGFESSDQIGYKSHLDSFHSLLEASDLYLKVSDYIILKPKP